MHKWVHVLRKAAVFSILEANSGYCQVKVETTDRNKVVFTSHYGLYRFVQMLFKLNNASRTLQRAMDVILPVLNWQLDLVHPDDIVIFLRSPRDHIDRVKQVMAILRDARVTSRLERYNFFTRTADCVGHIIRPRRLKIARNTMNAIGDLETSTDVTKIYSFSDCATISAILYPVLHGLRQR